ncbi:MAG: hypothetical protein IPK37_19240 [Austwickia sp.]|nr:MAG: hypothetical protein IPK37_19240 [Austwickia sp.]
MTPATRSDHTPNPDALSVTMRRRADLLAAPDSGLADRAIAGGVRRRRRAVAASAGGVAAALLLITGVALGTHQLGAFPSDQVPAATASRTSPSEAPRPVGTPGPDIVDVMTSTPAGAAEGMGTGPAVAALPHVVIRGQRIAVVKGDWEQALTPTLVPGPSAGLRGAPT